MTIRAKPLPTISTAVAPDLRRFLDRLRETFEDPNGLVTKTELLDTGAFKNSNAGNLQYVEPGEEQSYIAPPAPLNLAATGAMTSITLTWSGINYNSGYAYTEVWRASADNLGASVLIGTTTSGMYADAVGSDAAHYYWVRFVNVLNDKGPFNATAGVAGSTSPDLAYVFSQLTAAYGVSSDAPFFQLTSNTTINGVVIPAGTYIKEAKIHSGQITNAKIGNTIQSAAYVNGSAGWKIDKAGAMEMNNATFRGTLDVANAASGSRLKISATKIEVFEGSSGTPRVVIGDLS